MIRDIKKIKDKIASLNNNFKSIESFINSTNFSNALDELPKLRSTIFNLDQESKNQLNTNVIKTLSIKIEDLAISLNAEIKNNSKKTNAKLDQALRLCYHAYKILLKNLNNLR